MNNLIGNIYHYRYDALLAGMLVSKEIARPVLVGRINKDEDYMDRKYILSEIDDEERVALMTWRRYLVTERGASELPEAWEMNKEAFLSLAAKKLIQPGLGTRSLVAFDTRITGLMTAKEKAKQLGISPSTFRKRLFYHEIDPPYVPSSWSDGDHMTRTVYFDSAYDLEESKNIQTRKSPKFYY